MVRLLRNPAKSRTRVAGIVWLAGCATLAAAIAVAEDAPVHYLHAGAMPPGAIGSQQLLRGGPLPGYFQPVEVKAPEGAMISMAADGAFQPAQGSIVTAGMLIGAVYRLRVTNIPFQEGLEVFPTIEVVDRLYPPIGSEGRFPIPIQLTKEELELALAGKFVTRVIYLEDPLCALPVAEDPDHQEYFEAAPADNPLEVADRLGRPMAILRMGGRLPDAEGPDAAFLYGSPPWVRFRQPAIERVVVPPPARPGNAAPPPRPPEPGPDADDDQSAGNTGTTNSLRLLRTSSVTARPRQPRASSAAATSDARAANSPARLPLLISGSTTQPQQVAR
jgi:hypothetical protein